MYIVNTQTPYSIYNCLFKKTGFDMEKADARRREKGPTLITVFLIKFKNQVKLRSCRTYT